MLRASILRVAFFFSLFYLAHSSSAQQLVYKFKQYTSNDGLPSSEVHKVLRDSRNYMWFATDHGVCRYDGYQFETFNLPDNSILDLYEDSKKRIWAASFSGQLFYYENGKFNDYKYNNIIVKAINQIAINRFYVDSANNVYISTAVPTCFVINSVGEVKNLYQHDLDWFYKSFKNDNGRYFTYIYGSPETIYAQLKKGYPFKIRTHIIIKSEKKTYNIYVDAIIHGRKNGTIKLSNGDFLFFSGNFLIRIFKSGSYTVKQFDNNVLDVKELDETKLIVGTIQDGVFIIDNKNVILEHYFPGLTVTSIKKDYEGGVWISTTQAGVFYLNSLQMKHFSEKGVIINRKILSVSTENSSTVWGGEESGRILFFEIGKRMKYYNFPVVSINGIYTNKVRGKIVVCAGTINNRDATKFVTYASNGNIFIFLLSMSDLVDSEGRTFCGGPTGISKLNFDQKTLELQNKINFRVSTLFLDYKKQLLVGNLLGLWLFVNGELQPYDSTKKILSSRITDIDEYQKQYLLLGTRGNGFLVLANDSLYQITIADGISSNSINKIYVDDDVIWLATNRGISSVKIISMSPFKYSIANISAEDGLLSNEVNDIKRLDTNIIAATDAGITAFSRKLYAERQQRPLSLYITGVKINNLDTSVNQQYDLSQYDRNFSISYVALSYRESSNIEYRYRLLGIDSNWVYNSGREIHFNPIPYGRYAVQIQARRQGEDWIDANTVSLTINCRSPFWKTTWFYIVCFLILSFLMLLFFNNRTKKIKEREKERTLLNKKLADMELKALRAQMNPHFIFNVLNSIQYYIVHNENEEAQRYMSKFAKLVRLTLDNSRSSFISFADELSLLRLYIELEKIRFENQFDYQINIQDNIPIDTIKIPNMLLQPYVENSIKHGFKAKGVKCFLNILISKKGGKIICTIEDNGIGREQAALIPGEELEKHTSTGTVIIREKIDALKFYYNYDLFSKTEDLKDENGKAIGTRVTLIFPEKTNITETL